MIVRTAWIPGCGTYTVATTSQVYDPTAGHVSFRASQPKHAKDAATTELPSAVVVPRDEVATKPALQCFLRAAALANLATLERQGGCDTSGNPGNPGNPGDSPATWNARGAPTEIAVQVFAARFGCSRTRLVGGRERVWQHLAEFPFDSDVKRMSVLFRDSQTRAIHVFAKVSRPYIWCV